MKALICIVMTSMLICSCSFHPPAYDASSNSKGTSGSGKTKKPKASYKSRKYHASINHHNNVDDVITDKTLKNAANVKKANRSSSAKYKNKQAAYLRSLNNTNKYKNSKRNDGVFYLY